MPTQRGPMRCRERPHSPSPAAHVDRHGARRPMMAAAARPPLRLLLLLLLLSVLLLSALGVVHTTTVSFQLPAHGERCLHKAVRKDLLLVYNYRIEPAPTAGLPVSLMVRPGAASADRGSCSLGPSQVTDTLGQQVYGKKELGAEGKFAFSPEQADMYLICFRSPAPGGASLAGGPVRDALAHLTAFAAPHGAQVAPCCTS